MRSALPATGFVRGRSGPVDTCCAFSVSLGTSLSLKAAPPRLLPSRVPATSPNGPATAHPITMPTLLPPAAPSRDLLLPTYSDAPFAAPTVKSPKTYSSDDPRLVVAPDVADCDIE